MPDAPAPDREPALPAELVRQRETWDCGVACLAMVTGRTYEDVLSALPHSIIEYAEANDGIPTLNMAALLGGFGLATRTVFAKLDRWWEDGLAGLRLADVKGHYVVVLPDNRVLDPAQGETDVTFYPQAFHVWEIHRPEAIRAQALRDCRKRIESVTLGCAPATSWEEGFTAGLVEANRVIREAQP